MKGLSATHLPPEYKGGAHGARRHGDAIGPSSETSRLPVNPGNTEGHFCLPSRAEPLKAAPTCACLSEGEQADSRLLLLLLLFYERLVPVERTPDGRSRPIINHFKRHCRGPGRRTPLTCISVDFVIII